MESESAEKLRAMLSEYDSLEKICRQSLKVESVVSKHSGDIVVVNGSVIAATNTKRSTGICGEVIGGLTPDDYTEIRNVVANSIVDWARKRRELARARQKAMQV